MSRSPQSASALQRYAILTAAATWLLLIAGGLVTSTDSGLAVPDWPLSYGTWFPPMVGGILYEHGHRMIAAGVGLLILGLAVWVWRVESRGWVRWLSAGALGAVVLQILLGGLTVLLLLPPSISIAHACLGQAVFCLVVMIARSTAPAWVEAPTALEAPQAATLRLLGGGVAVLAAGQLLLGAVIRHTGHAVPMHLAGALSLAVLTVWLGRWLARLGAVGSSLRASAWRVAALLALQLILGGLVWVQRSIVLLRTAHVAVGALFLAQAVMLAWELRRRTDPAARAPFTSLLELTKPRVTGLVLLTTAIGFCTAGPTERWLWRLSLVLLGTALVAGGANALNQWMERDADGRMDRTKSRPLPSGRLRPAQALWFGIGISLVGLAALALTVNGLAAALAAASLLSYIAVYTPLKRTTSLCTLVGAIPGALPPMIGWAAAQGALAPGAWALFLILFVWQLPHFLAIAELYRADYARGGFRMLPLLPWGEAVTARQMVGYGLVLVPVSLLPACLGLAGRWYGYGALAFSVVLLGYVVLAALQRSAPACRRLFLASVAYLPLLLLLLVADRVR